MSLIEKVESLEDEILSLEGLLENKKLELERLLRGAQSPCLRKVKKHTPKFTKNFIHCLKGIYYSDDFNFKKIDNNNRFIFVKLNSFWETLSVSNDYTRKDFIKELKLNGFIEKNSCDYYKNVKINGRCVKALCINFNKMLSMFEEA